MDGMGKKEDAMRPGKSKLARLHGGCQMRENSKAGAG